MKLIAGGVAALLLCTAAAHAAPLTFQNGSFEDGASPNVGPGFLELNAPSTAITGWTVSSGSVDYIGTYWQPEDGSRSIDLSGSAPGALSQSFSDTAGQNYTVSFWIAGNTDGAPNPKTVQASLTANLIVADPSYTYTFDTTGHSRSSMGWVEHSFTFTGSGSDTLTFTDLDLGSPYGAALDNVSISSVPLPASAPMFGAALLAVGAIGYSMKRKKAAAAA